jgi:phosphoglycerate dehydrogenase-like enzyme
MNVLATRTSSMDKILSEADYVVVSVPSTAETRALIGERDIARMKQSAVLLNVARGDVLDENALIDALRNNRLRGAGLDVFSQEPLPAESGLWQLDNVLILPHISGTSPHFWERESDLIVENIGHYLRGEEMLNVVDKTKGY